MLSLSEQEISEQKKIHKRSLLVSCSVSVVVTQ